MYASYIRFACFVISSQICIIREIITKLIKSGTTASFQHRYYHETVPDITFTIILSKTGYCIFAQTQKCALL